MTKPYAQATEAFGRTMEGTKAGAEALGKSVGAVARISQTIGIEWMDYLKQAGSEATAAAEKLAKSGSPTKAIEIQTAFVKASGETMMARAAIFGDLYATLAQDMIEPFAALGGRTSA